MSVSLKKIRSVYKNYERYFMPGMLLGGVLLDFFTFKTLEIKTAFAILGLYLCLATGIIVFLHVYKVHKGKKFTLLNRFYIFSPVLLQFFFGALLSASFVFYWYSGSLYISWPFMIILGALMVGNERFRSLYLNPIVQFTLYFFVFFTLMSVLLPYVFNSIHPFIFVLAGAVSFIWFFLLTEFISKYVSSFRQNVRKIRRTSGVILASMFLLYGLNIIPPIPLSVRDAGVYHSVQRNGSEYILEQENQSFLERLIPGRTIERVPGKPIYVFSSIFAPADLSTTIVHHWQYFDELEGAWVTQLKASYNLTGGREEGYRGYSLSRVPYEGRWRVRIETERGQVLGRIAFRVMDVQQSPITTLIRK